VVERRSHKARVMSSNLTNIFFMKCCPIIKVFLNYNSTVEIPVRSDAVRHVMAKFIKISIFIKSKVIMV
jgi:hypothetical protein